MREEQTKMLVKDILGLMTQMRKALVTPLKLPSYDISPIQIMILGTVEAFGVLNMTQISNEIAVSNQQLTKLVDGLVVKGYVERSVNPKNRRAYLISLTEKGTTTLENHRNDIINAVYPSLIEIPQNKLDELEKHIIEIKAIVKEFSH